MLFFFFAPWKIEFSRNLFELLTRFYYFMEQTEIPTPPPEGEDS